MTKLTIEDLQAILVACAGGDEADTITSDFSGKEFDELGYDSLALIETAAHLKQEYGVTVPDEVVTAVNTPGELLDIVNEHLVTSA